MPLSRLDACAPLSQPITRSRDAYSSIPEKQLGEARATELAHRTQNFVLRRTNEILLQYLPEKIEQVLFIPLTPFQANIYRGLLQGKAIRQVLSLTSGFGHDALALQSINSLKKLCNHPALVYEEARELAGNEPKSALSFYPENYVPQSNFADVTQSSKLAVLDHLLASVKREGNKIVVVSNYIQTLDMLAAYLQSKKYQYLRLDGQTPAQERGGLVDRFNSNYSSEAFVFLLSAKAGGVRQHTEITQVPLVQIACVTHCLSQTLCGRYLFVLGWFESDRWQSFSSL